MIRLQERWYRYGGGGWGGEATVLLKITQSSSSQEVIAWFGLVWVVKLEASKLEKYVLLEVGGGWPEQEVGILIHHLISEHGFQRVAQLSRLQENVQSCKLEVKWWHTVKTLEMDVCSEKSQQFLKYSNQLLAALKVTQTAFCSDAQFERQQA